MKSLSGTIIVIALLGLLAYTNPKMENYAQFIQSQMVRQAGKDNPLASFLTALFGNSVNNMIAQATIRDDYVFFSVYDSDFGKDNGHVKSIGILNNFIVMESTGKFNEAKNENSAPVPASAPIPATPMQPGQVFHDTLSDGTPGPDMVKIHGGRFLMGSPLNKMLNEMGRNENERQHEVQVADFAIGKYEVTVGQFKRFVEAANYKTEAGCNWRSPGFSQTNEPLPGFSQTDEHPVVCVSWNDAMAYVDWLSKQTSQKYHLPTEAEWEYAARAGTQTAYYWGDDPDQGCTYANGADQTIKEQFPDEGGIMNCRDGHVYAAPVGDFRPNAWGLYDMLGNVWEWTCSEYDKDYGGAEQRCVGDKNAAGGRVVRGGSWLPDPGRLRGTARGGSDPHGGAPHAGFRVART